jgi:hypothetical protein
MGLAFMKLIVTMAVSTTSFISEGIFLAASAST